MLKMFCLNKQPMPDKTLLFLANSGQNVSSKVLNPQCKIILLLLFYVRAPIYSQASLGCHFIQAKSSQYHIIPLVYTTKKIEISRKRFVDSHNKRCDNKIARVKRFSFP